MTLTFERAARHERLDQRFAEGFEKNFYSAGAVTKRGGRFVKFLGLPCYQAESELPRQKTMVTRVFLAHEGGFSLGMVGGKNAVEQSPDFELAMNGFAFMEPPAPQAPRANFGAPPDLSVRTGQVAGWCVLGVVVAASFRWLTSKKKV